MGLAVWTRLISEGPPVIKQFYYIEKNYWLAFWNCYQKSILIESWVRQVAPKILNYPSAHFLRLCSNSFKVKEPSAFWKNAEAVQLRIPWMWCNYIPESIVIPMMMTVTNYSSIVTGNPFLSFNDFFPWLESSSYFREGHRRSWLMNFKWMNFISTRP